MQYMIHPGRQRWFCAFKEHGKRAVTVIVAAAMLVSACQLDAYAQQPDPTVDPPAATPRQPAATHPVRAVPHHQSQMPAGSSQDEEEASPLEERITITASDTTAVATVAASTDSIVYALTDSLRQDEWVPREVEFTPDPTKATWLSALFPGLGQIYNRRYWKLPIIVGGYLGLAYATDWNNSMLRDYTKAYADLLDNDPNTRSYMDMFSPNVKEENLDRSWLENIMRSRKNYFRRNRDLCIICMVGVYLLAMVDAYVDASLSHFDISPDLSMDVVPALMQDGRQRYPSVGLVWAVNF